MSKKFPESDIGEKATLASAWADEADRQPTPPPGYWDAATWSGTILKEPNVDRSKTKLDARLAAFLQGASPEDQRSYESSRQNLLRIVAQAREQQGAKCARKGPDSDRRLIDSIKHAYKSTSETAYQYMQVLDVMIAPAPDYVGVMYGAVKILLVAQVNYEEMKQNVLMWMDRIKGKFETVDHLTSYFPSQRLVNAICRLYDAFQRFLARALKYYARSTLANTFAAFRKPWRALEPIVDLIEAITGEIRDIVIFSSHYTGQMNLQITQSVLDQVTRVSQMMEANCVKFTKESDVQETSYLFRQGIEAKIEQHGTSDPAPAAADHTPDAKVPIPRKGDQPPAYGSESLDDHLSSLFTDLAEFDAAAARQERMTEQIPEMQAHRRTQRNMLKVDKIMDWLESEISQLLWVNGSQILNRQNFNTSFVVPLMIFGESSFDTCLVLRHFCGDSSSLQPSNFRVLLQSLLRQLLKHRPDVWANVFDSVSAENTKDIRSLWSLFALCIKQAKADCTFIVIDSIDFLVSEKADDGIEAKEFIVNELNGLVKDSTLLVKILLTASLSHSSQAPQLGSQSTALQTLASTVTSQPQNTLSMDIIRNDLALVPQKLLEVQEKRTKTIRFAQLPMLYPVNSTIYTHEDGHLRAYVVCELSGMDPMAFGTYSPLVIRVWAIDHVKGFIKRSYTLHVGQFAGEVAIDRLQYIPSGYLPDEHDHRQRLIKRGRRYWELSSKVHFMQAAIDGTPHRAIVDQHLRPNQSGLQQLDVRLASIPAKELKPWAALACPPQISAYCLQDNTWRDFDIDTFERLEFKMNVLDKLILDDKKVLSSSIKPFRDVEYSPARATLMLLHGGPGVGKTTTARYAAEHIRRPLVEISAGDIAANGGNIVASFRRILEHAERRKAVLLLENVEVLFPQSKQGVEAQDYNLVAMAKSLENYRGLVFLTTDRIGLLADLMRSRISVPVEFPPFEAKTRSRIWKQVLEDHQRGLSQEMEAKIAGYIEPKIGVAKDINGWDITNAFDRAVKFALAEDRPLQWEDLERSLQLLVDLKIYMLGVYGVNEAERATQSGFRATRTGR